MAQLYLSKYTPQQDAELQQQAYMLIRADCSLLGIRDIIRKSIFES